MIRFVDLFCGIGGLRVAMEAVCLRLGMPSTCVLSSDIDRKARETYSLNFGREPEGDIRDVDFLPEHDVLLAGFPCQPFSYAGQRRGFGDTRGTLFFEIERLVSSSLPPLVVLENVRGLVTHDRGRTLDTIVGRLNDLGYGVQFRVLNSADFGVPQNRMRLYIMAILGATPTFGLDECRRFIDTNARVRAAPTLFEVDGGPSVSEVLESEVDESYFCSEKFNMRMMEIFKNRLEDAAGYRMIDSRNGKSIHSWDVGLKGKCSVVESQLLNSIVANRRRHAFGTHQDGKALSENQIREFFDHPKLSKLLAGLVTKGYLRKDGAKFNLTAGNMSFEVYKILDPRSISVTVVSSDAHKIGVVQNGRIRRLTPREVARLQGFPDSFVLHPIDAASYRQLGNSVSVPVVEAVLKTAILDNQKVLPSSFSVGKSKARNGSSGRVKAIQ